jgi:competence protein ComEA
MLKYLLASILLVLTGFAFAAVEVNTATTDELTTIKGIGYGIASNIVEAREEGRFKDWNDLIHRVRGIAATSAAKFSTEGLTVNQQSLDPRTLARKTTEGNVKVTCKDGHTYMAKSQRGACRGRGGLQK